MSLPLPEHTEETIFLSFITLRRKYKKVKTSKRFTFEEIRLSESFIHKGISADVIIRRRGVLNRFRKLTGWTRGEISIINIEYLTSHSNGCPETLMDISKENV